MTFEDFFKPKTLQSQIRIKEEKASDFIFDIRKTLGLQKFKIVAEEVFQNLPDNFKPFIDIKDFTKDDTVRDKEKVGRNDPCPCGSGKKYKKCCGS
tara:strand:- start:1899 stop:2186 length:288 start_codon:yes stop_codon:yes gene_type:complete